MVVGAGVNISESIDAIFDSEATTDANLFARSGGVLRAVENTLSVLAPNLEVRAERCDGLANCLSCLQAIKEGKRTLNFVEGMACQAGCIGGPGTLTDSRVTTRLLDSFANSATHKAAPENTQAERITELGLHKH
jgi:iron only hydrogenase large subunit-like protein